MAQIGHALSETVAVLGYRVLGPLELERDGDPVGSSRSRGEGTGI